MCMVGPFIYSNDVLKRAASKGEYLENPAAIHRINLLDSPMAMRERIMPQPLRAEMCLISFEINAAVIYKMMMSCQGVKLNNSNGWLCCELNFVDAMDEPEFPFVFV